MLSSFILPTSHFLAPATSPWLLATAPRELYHFFRFLFLVLGFCLIPASHAQTLVESYTTRLSEQDHFSSSGERLRSAAAIIRQDRANFHKFGRRDPGDQHDAFFASPSNREALERMLNRGKIDQSLSQMIIDGTPFVSVEIFRDSSGSPYITVTPFE